MSRIKKLDALTINNIAAGEVVERPASVVKELCENALDADANVITIVVEKGGIQSIQIIDNGQGMSAEDAVLAFESHTTSKLTHLEDLEHLFTMGFRGEALASIASVSKTTLITKPLDEDEGFQVVMEGGKLINSFVTHCQKGTQITVENLFYNTPARFKFLKKDTTEMAKIVSFIEQLALARPDVSFRLISNGKTILHTPGNNDLESAIFSIFGKNIMQSSVPIANIEDPSPIQVSGYISLPEWSKSNRSWQMVFVNNRVVKSPTVISAIDEAYRAFMMKGKYPFVIIKIEMPPELVDVNVHPQKLEVRFWDQGIVFSRVMKSIKNTILSQLSLPQLPDSPEVETVIEKIEEEKPKVQTQLTYVNEEIPIPPVAETKIEPWVEKPDKTEVKVPVQQPVFTPEVKNEVKKKDIKALKDLPIIGVAFKTFILLQDDQEILVVDQHAAHEKILFEAYYKAYMNQKVLRQTLLVPLSVDLLQSERLWLSEYADVFTDLGFDIEPFGEQTVLIRSVPSLGEKKAFDLFDAIIKYYQESYRVQKDFSKEEIIYNIVASIACKAAVKANDGLGDLEIKSLIQDLMTLEHPYQCPHGRPVIVSLTKTELEKRFKRI